MNAAARALLGHERPPEYSLAKGWQRPSPYQLRDDQGRPFIPEQWPSTRIFQGETLRGTGAVDMRLVSPDGREHEVNASGAPVRDQAGQMIGAVAVLHEVTERRNLERRTQERSKRFWRWPRRSSRCRRSSAAPERLQPLTRTRPRCAWSNSSAAFLAASGSAQPPSSQKPRRLLRSKPICISFFAGSGKPEKLRLCLIAWHSPSNYLSG